MPTPSGFTVRLVNRNLKPPYANVVLPDTLDGTPSHNPAAVEEGRVLMGIAVPTDGTHELALGKFLTAWSLLESTLSLLLGCLLAVDVDTAHVVSNALGIRDLSQMALGVAALRLSDADMAQLDTLLDRVRKYNTKRNVLIHGAWILEVCVLDGPRLESHFLRELRPPDSAEATKLDDPKNQKIRARWTYRPKRIVDTAGSVDALREDVCDFYTSVTADPQKLQKLGPALKLGHQ
jgi:hypothetical protein